MWNIVIYICGEEAIFIFDVQEIFVYITNRLYSSSSSSNSLESLE